MTIRDCVLAAIAAGFRDDALATIVAISGAESGYDAAATADTRGRTDFPQGISPEFSVGPLQINLLAHPDIAEADARDYGKAFAYAYTLSAQGTDFSPWSTFGADRFRDFLLSAESEIAAVQQAASPGAPADLAARPQPAINVPDTMGAPDVFVGTFVAPGGPDTSGLRTMSLDEAQAQVALTEALTLIEQGRAVARVSTDSSTGLVTISVTAARDAIVAGWPALDDVLPH